jgi:predicted Zn-ribbon and HTH transcriptional regulator
MWHPQEGGGAMLEELQRFLEMPVGQMTLREVLGVGALAAIGIIVVGKYRRYLLRKGIGKHMVNMRCLDCQWRGRAGRYARRCPKCGSVSVQVESVTK